MMQHLGTDGSGRDVFGADPMGVRVEVWPVAADDTGLWLISGDDAWRSDPLRADVEPHQSVELILDGEGALDDTLLMHSTSWRMDDGHVMVTYMAVVGCPHVRAHWPGALPVSTELIETVGRPMPTHPTTPPLPRYVDVLHHGLRHLAYLAEHDAPAREVLSETWLSHLAAFGPALSGMYQTA